MAILVADVGGTNTRLALVADHEVIASASSKFSNSNYGSFYEIVAEFLSGIDVSGVSACCVAMAGPVFAGRGKLTNLDWNISDNDLRAKTGAPKAVVVNDLTALGFAVGRLGANDLTAIQTRDDGKDRNGQSLVVGIGTGFNVCPVKTTPSGATICFEAEGGHIGLSPSVMRLLQAEIGEDADRFETTEDLFSGRGLALLHRLRSKDSAELTGGQIVRAHAQTSDAKASRSLQAFSRMMGAHCRELMLQYLPLDGIYFAGSVARGVLNSGLGAEFISELDRHKRFKELLSRVPVSVINEDAAALVGCVVAARLV